MRTFMVEAYFIHELGLEAAKKAFSLGIVGKCLRHNGYELASCVPHGTDEKGCQVYKITWQKD